MDERTYERKDENYITLGINAWGYNKIETIQCRAARWVTNNYSSDDQHIGVEVLRTETHVS